MLSTHSSTFLLATQLTDFYLQEERARNRKLEEELSRLKRAAGPGKSPLSPRYPPPSS